MKKIKTIDVNALEWFDKVNGNSYFAGTITVNYAMPGEQTFIMPYQYGYGSQYEQEAYKVLKEKELIPEGVNHLWQVREHGIVLRHQKIENCKKRELIAIGK